MKRNKTKQSETKWNETKQNKKKQNETKRNKKWNKMKRNETKQNKTKWNETKQNKMKRNKTKLCANTYNIIWQLYSPSKCIMNEMHRIIIFPVYDSYVGVKFDLSL